MNMLVLAAEGGKLTLYGQLLGVMVAISAVSLFYGSIWLLLSTNLGARLGFLVAGGVFSGLLMLLSVLWMTTATPLNVPRGQIASWRVQQSLLVQDLPAAHKFPPQVRDITKDGRQISIDDPEFANVKSPVDQALVTKTAIGGVEPAPEVNKFAEFNATTDYKVTNIFEFGGSKPNLLKLQVHHKPLYAAVLYCPILKIQVPFGEKPPDPQCDSEQPVKVLIMQRDLGSLRVPPMVAFAVSSLSFLLFLLLMHWRELDERAARRASEPAPSAPEPEKETVDA